MQDAKLSRALYGYGIYDHASRSADDRPRLLVSDRLLPNFAGKYAEAVGRNLIHFQHMHPGRGAHPSNLTSVAVKSMVARYGFREFWPWDPEPAPRPEAVLVCMLHVNARRTEPLALSLADIRRGRGGEPLRLRRGGLAFAPLPPTP